MKVMDIISFVEHPDHVAFVAVPDLGNVILAEKGDLLDILEHLDPMRDVSADVKGASITIGDPLRTRVRNKHLRAIQKDMLSMLNVSSIEKLHDYIRESCAAINYFLDVE